MANVIKNLLVGIGFDYDKRGQREVESGISSVSSKALQLGTVVAGAFGARALTVGFADSRDALGKFSETLGVTADDVSALGNAVAREGGSFESYLSQLENLEKLRAGLLVGDAEFISIAGKAGIDTTELIAARDATEAYLSLANQFQGMNQQQRLNAANALGLDDASIRLLSRGREGVEDIADAQRKMRPVTQSMIETSREFNTQLHDLVQNAGGVTDQISDTLLPAIVDITEGVNDWFAANDKLINQNLDSALKPIADNFTMIASAGGLLAAGGALGTFAGLAKYVPLIGGGMATIAASASSLALLGGAGVAGYAAGGIIDENLDDDTRMGIGRTTAQVLAFFGNDNAQSALDSEKRANIRKNSMLDEYDVPIYTPATSLDEYDVPIYTPAPPASGSGSNARPIRVEASFNLDGNVIDRRIIDVTERQNQQAIDDLSSNVRG